MKELIEFLEVQGFTEQAERLKNGEHELNFKESNIGAIGVEKIANFISLPNSFLTKLSLFNIPLFSEDAAVIAEALKFNKSLEELELISCKIGNEGAIVIAKALRFNNSLTEINLACCEIEKEGAIEISNTLEFNKSLTRPNTKDRARSGKVEKLNRKIFYIFFIYFLSFR